jgi:curved DNA-binding protein
MLAEPRSLFRPPRIDSHLVRRLLGVAPDADAEVLRRAFKLAVEAAHPDRPGGDGERLRQMIEAYRRLEATPASPPAPEPDPAEDRELRLRITPAQALTGGWTRLRLEGVRELSVRLPAGLRAGDLVRISGQTCRIAIANGRETAINGDNLMMVAQVPRAMMQDGGRLTIETPARETSVWITKVNGERGFARVAGLGLPARGARRAGDLILHLRPASAPRFDTPAQVKRRRFVALWAA